MSALARWIARALWAWMLWFMRRPWMKWLQRATPAILPPRMRESARHSITRQNRIARRYGLVMLTVSLNVLLASVVLTLAFLAAIRLAESGALTLPDRIRNR